jgi:cobalt/nickel transport system permease protein
VKRFVLAGLVVAAALALFVSPWASSAPDGLDKVAKDHGLQQSAHPLDRSPAAGYELRGVDDHRLSTGLAGLAGVVVTFAVAGGLVLVVRRRTATTTTRDVHHTPGT